MSRWAVLAGLLGAVGATLVLAELRWFRRGSLAGRIGPYLPGGRPTVVTRPGTERAPVSRSGQRSAHRARTLPASWKALREVAGPLAASGGNALSRLFGISEELLGTRLERTHATETPTSYRLRQLGTALVALAASALACLALRPPGVVALLFLVGAPLLAFLVLEQRVARDSARWQAQLRGELPLVAEQLGMLLGAGYSLAGALNRLAQRGSGASAADLARVCQRLRQGLGEQAALAEWADLAQVDELDRLVSVLALNQQAADLGQLIGEEARAMRADAQRRLIERIERRAQQVWVPVTVAALVPGVLFLVVPFIQAMRLFSTG